MKNRKIKVLLGALIVLVLCVGIIIKNKTNTLSNSSLNKESITKELDNNLIGAYIQEGEEYKQANEIPSSGYEFNSEKSYCTVNGENINATINFDIETQTLSVVPLTKKGTKCYLYFDEKSSGSEYILASPNAPTNHTTDWTGKESYYYTGNPDNWVSFAGFYWRIIRINGDGSIRMIYQGVADSPTPDAGNMTGEGTQIGTGQFNSSDDNNMYVGYMYQSRQLHGLQTSSTIKGVLDSWYKNNIANKGYGEYVDGNSGFCGDRRVTSGTGISTSTTYYQPGTRISNSSPSLTCQTEDIYTTSGSGTGNKALTQPIGLISADEAMFAGIPWWANESNTNNYLYTDNSYWTMSPDHFSSSYAYMLLTGSSIGFSSTSYTAGVRPVINIRADVQITGSGTSIDPFIVVGA